MNNLLMTPEGLSIGASFFDKFICAAMLAIPAMMFWALSQQAFFIKLVT